MLSATELYDKVKVILTQGHLPSSVCNKLMHDTLVLCCHEGVRDSEQSFGNLFAQVDYLCRIHGICIADKIDMQTMRRHSNKSEAISHEDLLYDTRALCILISAVFATDVPSDISPLLPHTNRPRPKGLKVDRRRIRAIIQDWDKDFIHVTIDQDTSQETYMVQLRDETNHIDHQDFLTIIRKGAQVNLLDCQVKQAIVTPRLIVYEPDFLIDISSIAACFVDYGHHPLQHLVRQMMPKANTQPILLGNFASAALDDIINTQGQYQMLNTVKSNFKERALEYSTCEHFDARKFYADATQQAFNLQQVVEVLFPRHADEAKKNAARGEIVYNRSKAILEPSFVCEALGVQGRVDLMTTDCKLLVEQKAGRNINIENSRPDPNHHGYQLTSHYVQLLLYYGVLQHNFHLGNNAVNIRLLYSKYPPQNGLMVVAYYQQLFQEAISYRNQLVALYFELARNGFETCLDELTPETLNTNGMHGYFYQTYLLPPLSKMLTPLHRLSPLEHDYYCRMMTFVLREQMIAKVGAQEGTNTSNSDLWTMPVAEKKDIGNIYTDLHIVGKEKSSDFNGYDTITLSVPEQGEDFLPNFRKGDMVYLYAYRQDEIPDVRNAILYKGILQEIHTDTVVVHLNDGQQNSSLFSDTLSYAIEHGSSDIGTGSNIRSLHQFICSPQEKRNLLLGQRCPLADKRLQLHRSYDPVLDGILLKAKQAQDYFLLVGPPGTGKTSHALKYLVQESLCDCPSVLLMSYTNRAVDEICEMLADADIPFLRIGSEFACDERFHPFLIEKAIADTPKLDIIRQRVLDAQVIVGTTSTMMSKSYIFDLKHFPLAIIDESSQILEPGLVGLLTAVDKFILIGDHKQLPAVVQQSEKDSAVESERLKGICLTNCRNSLFERLIHWEQHEGRTDFIGVLRKQGRMHPDIAVFPNRMFYRKEQLEPVPCPHQLDTELHYDLPSKDELDDLIKQRRMLFLPSAFCKSPNVSDKVNTCEATMVADLLYRIHRFYGDHFDCHKSVGVIVPYRNQIAMIRKETERMVKLKETDGSVSHEEAACLLHDLQQISIDTVERYQGSQRDVIIYSFTIQNYWQLEFLTANSLVEDGYVIDRKLNVAITRAKKQMIMVGNQTILKNNPIFAQLIEFAKA